MCVVIESRDAYSDQVVVGAVHVEAGTVEQIVGGFDSVDVIRLGSDQWQVCVGSEHLWRVRRCWEHGDPGAPMPGDDAYDRFAEYERRAAEYMAASSRCVALMTGAVEELAAADAEADNRRWERDRAWARMFEF